MFGAGLNTVYDWNITTEAGQNGVPATPWPRGKVIGGSSALNFLVWDRPTARAELDAWEELGATGWNWNLLYRTMKKSEKFYPPSSSQTQKMGFTPTASDYGRSGPIQVSYPLYISKQVSNWLTALKSLGIPTTTRMDGTNVGAALQPGDINPANSTRSYSAAAYYWPNEGRKNLQVVSSALVDKIIFTSSRNGAQVASGVSYSINGQQYTIPVKREVIVSAGTVFTPSVLERSGIGKKSVLDAAGVKQLIDLPVGENLQDHTYTMAAYELKDGNGPTLDSLRNNQTYATQQQAVYAANSRSPASILTEVVPSITYITLKQLVGQSQVSALVNEADAYAKADTSPYNATLKKQVEFLKSGANSIGQMELIGIDGYFASNAPPTAGKNYVTFLAAQQHALSRGNIHITSSDPTVYPKVNANYFTADWDRKVSGAGAKWLRDIAATSAYGSYIEKEAVPGAAVPDSGLEEYATTTGFTTEYHPIGTASCLPRNKGGVVNPKLMVYGTQNVRVVDASIAPLHVSAHIQGLVYGIAEAAAEIILADQ